MTDTSLNGYTVGITAERRREELATLLERRGASVVSGPSIRVLPLPDDGRLLAATRACLEAPLDLAVATTGVGFRGWLEAADGWGLGAVLRESLGGATLLARGPKAAGAIRGAGLREEWSPESESSADVLAYLLELPLRGRRVAVQLHGEPQDGFCGELREAGADVVEVPVYRWELPADVAPLRRLLDLTLAGGVDALAFTSAPAVESLLRFAAAEGHGEAVVDALRAGRVVAACVGPVCAAPLDELGIRSIQPDRSRLAPLVAAIAAELPALLPRPAPGPRATRRRGKP